MDRSTQWTAFLLAALAILVLVLSVQNRQLRAAQQVAENARIVPSVGDWVPPFELSRVDGSGVSSFGGGTRHSDILFVFDPMCPVSREVAASLRHFEASADGEGVRIVGVSRAEEADVVRFLDESELGIPVYRSSAREHSYLGVRVVPTLLVIDIEGRVVQAHAGTINDTSWEEIRAAIQPDRRVGVARM